MACLALSLQPSNGSDILLQTREWFPPARALAALAAFRHTRLSFSSNRHPSAEDLDSSALGDDPLAASSGQVTVGVESKYRVVYRLVNGIYVLGITTTDDSSNNNNNVFDCINTVNQAVSVVVAACRGVDVTPEKLHRKYPEIYMALDIVLHGVTSLRLSSILSSIHGDSIAKMVHSALDADNRSRGADAWSPAADRDPFPSTESFELPPETLAAGDEVAAAIAPTEDPQKDPAEDSDSVSSPEEKDPFAASEKVNNLELALVGDLKKSKDSKSSSDPVAALAGLEVSSLPPAAATKPTFIGVEGFEGQYGGIEFNNNEPASFSEAFEGFNNAFGGGLDASEFVTDTKNAPKATGLGGLEFLESSGQGPAGTATATAPAGTPLEDLLVTKKKAEMTAPEMYISEVINAEFRESLLARVGFQGTVFLRTLPPKQSAAGNETEFSFRLEGTSSIRRAVMNSSSVSSLENGMFHVRTSASEDPIPILKYSLQPRLTPLPIRVRLVKRHSGTLLSVMIQYASNPALSEPLTNVTFIMKLPVDPTLLKVSPKAVLNREERELRWHVADVPLKGPPGCLRVRMPVDQDSAEGSEIEVVGMVTFSTKGATTLSGICLRPVSDGIAQFNEVSHSYESGSYFCT